MTYPDFIILLGIGWTTLSFFLYWPLFGSIIKKNDGNKIILVRIYGAILFGLIPLIALLLTGENIHYIFGLNWPSGPGFWNLIGFGLLIIALLGSFLQSKSPKNLKTYPQIRVKSWSKSLYVANILSWMIYLVGYELLFRGLLLFPLERNFGFWVAIFINVGIYSLTHMSKDYREALGCIPIGILLALIALKTQSILYPILIHWTMAVSNSIFSFYYHPEMKIEKSK
jgi:membrane protease YdiL (CAAX protease family)